MGYGKVKEKEDARGNIRKILVAFPFFVFLSGNLLASSVDGQHSIREHWHPEAESPEKKEPAFGKAETAIVGTIGSDVILPCRIDHLGDKLVSWIRMKDLQILTSGYLTFTTDDRFESYHRPNFSRNWDLLLRKTRKTDAGEYECQVNTDPKMSRTVKLKVVSDFQERKKGFRSFPGDLRETAMVDDEGLSPRKDGILTRVMGKREQFVKAGGTITFTCVVTSHNDEPISRVEWLKDGLQISFQTFGGGIMVDTEKQVNKATSRLTLVRAEIKESGNYTCEPDIGNGDTVALAVVVSEEDTRIAMERESSGQIKWGMNRMSFVIIFFCKISLNRFFQYSEKPLYF